MPTPFSALCIGYGIYESIHIVGRITSESKAHPTLILSLSLVAIVCCLLGQLCLGAITQIVVAQLQKYTASLMSLWIMADSMVLVSNVLGLSLTLLQMMLLTKSTERLWSCGLFGSMILLTLASDILSIWISCSSTDFLLHEWFGVYQKIQLATYLVQICFHLMSSWLFVPKIVQFLAKDTKLVEHLVLKHQLSKFVFLVLAKCAAIVSIIYPKSGFYKNVPALYLCWQLDTLIETHCVLLEQPSKQRRASVFAQHLQQSS